MNKEEKWLLEEGFGGEKSEAFFTALNRLHAGEPLAYIIGQIPFLDCTIYLDSKPLIPRAETEFWVEKLIGEITHQRPNAHVLDLCAGSGCIGVAIQKHLPASTVDFVELDPSHLTTIEKNLHQSGVIKKGQVLQSDLFDSLSQTSYDFIATNPPYIDPDENQAEYSVKEYEPAEALYGGNSGLELVAQIIHDAPDYLMPNGELWIEHDPEQEEPIKQLADSRFTVTTQQDQYQIARYSVLKLINA